MTSRQFPARTYSTQTRRGWAVFPSATRVVIMNHGNCGGAGVRRRVDKRQTGLLHGIPWCGEPDAEPFKQRLMELAPRELHARGGFEQELDELAYATLYLEEKVFRLISLVLFLLHKSGGYWSSGYPAGSFERGSGAVQAFWDLQTELTLVHCYQFAPGDTQPSLFESSVLYDRILAGNCPESPGNEPPQRAPWPRERLLSSIPVDHEHPAFLTETDGELLCGLLAQFGHSAALNLPDAEARLKHLSDALWQLTDVGLRMCCGMAGFLGKLRDGPSTAVLSRSGLLQYSRRQHLAYLVLNLRGILSYRAWPQPGLPTLAESCSFYDALAFGILPPEG